jgi:hypothetical protein
MLGIKVKHIPGGCTSLCQPINVGFNKPFKDWMRKLWMSWMIPKCIIHGMTRELTRLDVAKWVDNAMEEMQSDPGLMQNTWMKIGFEWFV